MALSTAAPRLWTAECSALLLDLDGTLVDSTTAVLRGWQTWSRLAGAATDGLADIVHGRSAAETIMMLLPGLDEELLGRHVHDVLKIQEEDPAPALPMPGAVELVAAAGTRWAVVTGCSAGMAAVRLAAGGLPAPAVLVTDGDVARGKPHPDGYLLALEQLGLPVSEAVAVEDAPAGIRAAKAAGLRTIALASTHRPDALTGADVVVSGLDRIAVSAAGARMRLAVAGERPR